MSDAIAYRGRFAPTPSGPLHLGSLLTALAGYLEARSRNGQWLLRFDDLDSPRCMPGADSRILRQLEVHGLYWDETVRYQSAHTAQYLATLDELASRQSLYPCTCTRAALARDFRSGPDGAVYAGTCRDKPCTTEPHALRLKVDDRTLGITDRCQGELNRRSQTDIGDFVVRRADGQVAYQLACVVNERAMCITHVVRGADLIGSSFRQIYLMKVLGLEAPDYLHLPLLHDAHGRKLSKQNHAAPIEDRHAAENLVLCLQLLGQPIDKETDFSRPAPILENAIRRWDPERIPARKELAIHGALQQLLA